MGTQVKKKKINIALVVVLIASFIFGVWFWMKSISTRSVAISFVESASVDDGWFKFAILNFTLPLLFCLIAAFAIELPIILFQHVMPKAIKIICKIIMFGLVVLAIYGLITFMNQTVTGTGGKIIIGIIVGIGAVIFLAPMIVAIFTNDIELPLSVSVVTAVFFALTIFILACVMYFSASYPFLALIL